jgi:putative nucleotidyltransferase with HDIG domain
MKKLQPEQLVPGMVTAEDVYNYNSQLIFPKGFILTERAISRLAFYSIPIIRVEDDIVDVPENTGIKVEPFLSHKEHVQGSEEFHQFREEFNHEVTDFKDRINLVVTKNAPIDTHVMLDAAFNLIDIGKKSFGIFDLLHSMRDNDDETYAHCLNVALICNVMSGWLDLSEEETRMATLCGMFHDVGKLKISDAILHKPGALTESERLIIQTHPLEGFNLLRGMDLDAHVKNATLMHHERCDGSGYPFGITMKKIDPYARLVAIADVYDAMTSTRTYREALSPFRTISIMEEEGLQKYDAQFIMTFLRNVVNTYINNRALLSNGEEGEIIFIHKDALSRPTLKCGDTFVDLSVRKDLDIVKII